MALQFLNASNAVIGQQVVNIDYDVDNDTTPPRVTQYSLQGVAPAGTVKVRVIGQNSGNDIFKLDANCLVDGVTVLPTATAVPTATPTMTPTPTKPRHRRHTDADRHAVGANLPEQPVAKLEL